MGACGVFLSGHYVYLCVTDIGLRILDVSDPASPELIGSCALSDIKEKAIVRGDYAYVPGRDSGLYIVDISDPTDPHVVGNCSTPGRAWAVSLYGEYACVADGDSGLQIIDIAAPDEPTIVGCHDTPDKSYGVFVSGDYAYVSAADSGIYIFEISDVANPSLAAGFDTPGRASRSFVAAEYIYVADGNYLLILSFRPETGVTVVGSLPLGFSLVPNYPNPFNSSTIIRYTSSTNIRIRIDILDVLGRKVETLTEERQTPGLHQVIWNADAMPSGIYFYRIRTDLFAVTSKMLLVR